MGVCVCMCVCYIVYSHTYPFFSFLCVFFTYVLPYLSFPLRIDPLHFQGFLMDFVFSVK